MHLRKMFVSLFTLTLFFANPIFITQAAEPNLSASLTKDSKYINLNFSNLKNISKVSYSITYDTGTRQTGFEGGFKVNPKSSRSVRKQILGTCSTHRCTFHKNPHNFKINSTFTLKDGTKTTKTSTLAS